MYRYNFIIEKDIWETLIKIFHKFADTRDIDLLHFSLGNYFCACNFYMFRYVYVSILCV